MKLSQIVEQRIVVEESIRKLKEEYQENYKELKKHYDKLLHLEDCGGGGLDTEKIIQAEKVIYVHGNPYGRTDSIRYEGKTIAERAIEDIACGFPHLKTKFYGNKIYSGFYQYSPHEYGFGPKHGRIVDEIGFKSEYRKDDVDISADTKDACIYYLKNYQAIKESYDKLKPEEK